MPFVLRWLNEVFFDIQSQYGMASFRPIGILLLGIFVFSVPYMVALRIKGTGHRSAIWRVWSPEHAQNPAPNSESNRDSAYLRIRPGGTKEWVKTKKNNQTGFAEREKLTGLNVTKSAFFGLYFSLLSALSVGLWDLNVSNWVTRLQPHEYALRATGWVRTLSGIQSLASLYLLILWVLTYFARPFG